MKRRGMLAGFLLTILLLLPYMSIPAEPMQPEKIRVGYSHNYMNYNANNRMEGYAYEYLREIAYYTDWAYEYTYGSPQELRQKLLAGEIDLYFTAGDYWREYPGLQGVRIGTDFGTIYISQDNKRVFYEDIDSFQNLTIGLWKGSPNASHLEAFAAERGFLYQPVYYETIASMQKALADGEVDAIAINSLMNINNSKIVATFDPAPIYILSRAGSTIGDRIQWTVERLWSEQSNFSSELYEKYRGGGDNQLAFTREEAAFLADVPVIRAACLENWYPLEYKDKNTGQWNGICIDILHVIESNSGLDFEFVGASTYDQVLGMVQKGEADIVCSHLNLPEEAAARSLLLTRPYTNMPATFVKRMDKSSDIETAVIGITTNYTKMANIILQEYPKAQIVFYPTIEKLLSAVEWGRVDYAHEITYVLDDVMKNYQYDSLETVTAAQQDYAVCIGVSKNFDPMLLSILNKQISQIDAEQEYKIVLSNTTVMRRLSFSTVLQQYAFQISLLAVLVVGVILFQANRSRKQLMQYAFTDSLTGGPNWNRFELDAGDLLKEGKRSYAIVFMDIDQFKLINELHGYQNGDAILKEIYSAVKVSLQKHETACRMSADDFILLLHYQSQEELEERIQGLLKRVSELSDKQISFHTRCGIYKINEEITSVHTAVDRAKMAQQALGRNQNGQEEKNYIFYSADMKEKALYEKEIESVMEEALQNQEFVVYYQPKYGILSNRIIGAEALVRWRRKDGALVPPDKFISVFERNGFIVKLDLYVFEEVCATLKRWMEQGYQLVPISVNLSRVHLYEKEFYRKYIDIMHKYGIDAYLLELELTESIMFDNQEHLINITKALHDNGFLISMDDFGSGYSSLNLLKDIPIDVLKMDREFLNETVDSDKGRKIVSNIVQMARELSIFVVMEGVETSKQVEFLKSIHCDAAQGYFYAKPMEVAEFEKLLEQA